MIRLRVKCPVSRRIYQWSGRRAVTGVQIHPVGVLADGEEEEAAVVVGDGGGGVVEGW